MSLGELFKQLETVFCDFSNFKSHFWSQSGLQPTSASVVRMEDVESGRWRLAVRARAPFFLPRACLTTPKKDEKRVSQKGKNPMTRVRCCHSLTSKVLPSDRSASENTNVWQVDGLNQSGLIWALISRGHRPRVRSDRHVD